MTTPAAERRERIIALIRSNVTERGYPPSLAEIADATGVTVRRIKKDIITLRDQGRMEWEPGKVRTLRDQMRRGSRPRRRTRITPVV